MGKAVTIRALACVIDRRQSGSFSPSRVGNPQSSNSNCRNYTSRHDHRLCLLFLGRLCRQSLVRGRKTNRNSCSLRELAPCKAAAASSPANRFSLCHTGPCSLLCSRCVRPRLLRVRYTRPPGKTGSPQHHPFCFVVWNVRPSQMVNAIWKHIDPVHTIRTPRACWVRNPKRCGPHD